MLKPVGFNNNYSKPQIGFSARFNVLPQDAKNFIEQFSKIQANLPEGTKNPVFISVVGTASLPNSDKTGLLSIITTTPREKEELVQELQKITSSKSTILSKQLIKAALEKGRQATGEMYLSGTEALKKIRNMFFN